MIKLFEHYKEYNQIEEWLYEMGIKNYTINDDLTVDVDGNVELQRKFITEIPIQFGEVRGSFYAFDNKITSLKGCPNKVTGQFNFYNNCLTSLEGCPEEIGEDLNVAQNKLTTLNGSPNKVGGDLNAFNNSIKSLKGGPIEVTGNFMVFNNRLTSLKGAPEHIGGEIDIDRNPLPEPILDFSDYKILIKHQEEYGIWNNDGSFNEQRFNIFLNDYNTDLLD